MDEKEIKLERENIVISSVADYSQLNNKPKINNVELDGNKTLEDLGIENYDDSELRDDIRTINDNLDDLEQFKADKTEIPDTSNFITNAVDNLINYYKKSETYTQEEVNTLIGNLQSVSLEAVDELPETGESNVIYLVPSEDPDEQNTKDEYIWVDNDWEFIGSTKVGLSEYATKNYVDNAISNVPNIKTVILDGGTNPSAEDLIKLKEIAIAINNNEPIRIFRWVSQQHLDIDTLIDWRKSDNFYFLSFIRSNGITNGGTKYGISYQYFCYSNINFKYSSDTISNYSANQAWVYLPSNNESIIGKNNTTEWTPTGDYNPATKKYVDGAVATKQDTLTAGDNITIENGVISATGGSGGGTPVYYVNNQNNDANKAVLSQIAEQLYNDNDVIIRFNSGIGYHHLVNIQNYKGNKRFTMYFYCPYSSSINTYLDSNNNINYQYYCLDVWYNDNFEITTFDAYIKNYATLTADSTNAFRWRNYAGYDASKTQVLKNVNGTLTWVDEE